MNTKTKRGAVAASGIVVLTLLSAFTHAESVSYSQAQSVNTAIEEAAQVALNTVPGTLIEAELEMDDGRAVWEIDIVDAANQVVSVEVDGQTGQVLGTKSCDHSAPVTGEVFSMAQAIDMVRAVDSGVLVEVELENDDDQLIWEIETISEDRHERAFRIDGISGELI